MENSQNSYTGGQPGSGSAENRGDSREAQKAQYTQTDQSERKDLAEQAGLGRDQMTELNELGALSGRDDYAGGDNDGMSGQSTNEETDR
jgi:hypothetical protein